MTPGIHLVHKPVGPTSFSIVQSYLARARVEHPHHPPRICHGGTLDPFASGLLLILVGPATKLFDYLHDVPKVYEATVRWGLEMDNGDPLGTPVFTGDASRLSTDRLDSALRSFIGWHEQIPPATSNRRIGGERAYAKAHRGEAVELPPSRVYLHEARWLSHDPPNTSRVRLTTRGGYYVRALARDLGRQLGCGAHLTDLRRIAIGPWGDLEPDRVVELTGAEILPWLPSRILTDQEMGALRLAQPIHAGRPLPPDWNLPQAFPEPRWLVRAFHQDRLVFLLSQDANKATPSISLGRGL
ncbi:MAG TPA: tRNA pseudouridine(55) synthase TruB [Tepidisphaeraceae bacterium]|jgi:tRNA pseudouridine55 synthase|nr:tRNA pseudouridine(55) synthase TruB [Tepidisphaeraceae bacterium]